MSLGMGSSDRGLCASPMLFDKCKQHRADVSMQLQIATVSGGHCVCRISNASKSITQLKHPSLRMRGFRQFTLLPLRGLLPTSCFLWSPRLCRASPIVTIQCKSSSALFAIFLGIPDPCYFQGLTNLCLLGVVRDALYIIGSSSHCKQFHSSHIFTHNQVVDAELWA